MLENQPSQDNQPLVTPDFMRQFSSIDPQKLAQILKASGMQEQGGLAGGIANGMMMGSNLRDAFGMNKQPLPSTSLAGSMMSGTQLPTGY